MAAGVPVYAGLLLSSQGAGCRGVGVAGADGLGAGTGWRVFVSHTSELREFPAGGRYVAAVERAVSACGHVIVDMADFAAADLPPAQLCAERVRSCDLYVSPACRALLDIGFPGPRGVGRGSRGTGGAGRRGPASLPCVRRLWP
jgi:hypothetical protein